MIAKNKKRKIKNSIPIVIAGLIFVALVGAIIYLVITNGLFEPNDDLAKLNDPERTTAKVKDMVAESNVTCSNKDELLKEINNMKVEYKEVVTDLGVFEVDYSDAPQHEYDYATHIIISGISDKIYAQVTNSFDDEIEVVSSVNNQLDITVPLRISLVTMYVKFYTTDANCKDELIKQVSIEVPMANNYSGFSICDGYQDKVKECQKYIWEELNYEKVKEKVEEYKKKENK